MADPVPSVAIATGSLIVSGAATNFVAAENDLFVAGGAVVPIASRDSPTQITLKQPWPVASLSGSQSFSVLSLGEYWRSAISINKRFADLLAKWEVVSPFKFDAAGSLSERDNYNNQPKGFVYVATDQLPVRIYIKLANTNSPSDWSSPLYLGSGGQVEFEEALGQERQQRIDADEALSRRIKDTSDSIDPNLRRDLNAEVARSKDKDEQHDTLIGGLRTDLTAEAVTARSNESLLGGRIDVETAARVDTDNQLINIVKGPVLADPRDAYALLWALFRSLGGRSLAGFEADARFVMQSLAVQPRPPTRDGDEHAAAIHDMLGQIWLGLLRDGDVSRRGHTAAPTRDGFSHLDATYDLLRRVLIGFDHQGRADLRLSPYAAAEAARAIYIPPHAEWRGTAPVFNVRRCPHGLVASVQEADGRISDVTQRTAIPGRPALPTSIVAHVEPAEGVLFYGQSNAGHGAGDPSAVPPVLTSALYPSHAFAFSSGLSVNGAAGLLDPASLVDFAPLQDRADLPPIVATAFGAAREAHARRRAGVTAGTLAQTVWYGDQPIETFLPGTTCWNNLLTVAAGISKIAETYGKPIAPTAIVFIQGEQFQSNQSTYRPGLDTIIAQMPKAVAMAAGCNTPHLFLCQTNQGNTSGWQANGNELDQVAAARANLGLGVTLTGPMYQFPFADNIHLGALGRMMHGELIALVYDMVIRQRITFNPLWPVSITRSGPIIIIEYQLPPGGGALQWDTSWLPVVAGDHYGYVYSDDSNSASIASVAITAPDTVQITLSGTPTGANKKINYARGQTNAPPLPNGRGNLISPTGVPSHFYGLGYAVAPTINHYSVRFSGDVS